MIGTSGIFSCQRAARLSAVAEIWFLCASGYVAAATLNVQLLDAVGAPAADAVVYAEPAGGHVTAAAPKGAVINQINKEFVPRVSVVQTGAAVSFPNKDNIRHHVYSFSPAKTFQLKLYSGVPSQPVVFDKPGPVVLGCNIHDKMIAYLLVVDTPYFTKTDASGHALLEGLAPGEYDIKAWQPQASGANAAATQRVKTALKGDTATVLKLELVPAAN